MPETRDPQIEEMVRRLVAQAPPPPEFPTGPQRASRHQRALLVRGASLVGAAAIVVVVALIAAALLSTSHAAKHQVIVNENPTTTTSKAPALGLMQPTVVLDRVENAELYGADLVADPKSGVWFVITDNDSGAVRLDHLGADGSLRSIPLPSEFANGAGSRDPMLAVDPDGTAWVLGQRSLAEVGRTATMPTLIPLGRWPNTEIHLPEVLASDGSGHVAIAFEDTTLVRVYNASSPAFTDIQLPVGTDAWSLCYFADGSLAIGLSGFDGSPYVRTALIASPQGSLSRGIHVGDTEVASAYSDTAVLIGASDPVVLNRDGTTKAIALPTASTPVPFGGRVQRGRNGTLVVTTGDAITILASTSEPTPTGSKLTFPRTSCGLISIPPNPSPTGASGSAFEPICRNTPEGVTVGADGSIWLLYRTEVRGAEHLIVKRIDRY